MLTASYYPAEAGIAVLRIQLCVDLLLSVTGLCYKSNRRTLYDG